MDIKKELIIDINNIVPSIEKDYYFISLNTKIDKATLADIISNSENGSFKVIKFE